MIYAVHGFLGKASDWDLLELPKEAVDIFAFGDPSSSFGMRDWAQAFNATVKKRSKNFLIGYSLGGRLALHALIDNPSLWAGAVLISTHPGLRSIEQRKERLQRDEEWAIRFETEAWDSLMDAWNAQTVFAKSSRLVREEKDCRREQLADILRFWSLGHQDNLLPALAGLKMPVQFAVGEHDKNFCALAKELSLACPHIEIWIAPNSGHRVPWDSPKPLRVVVKKEFQHE